MQEGEENLKSLVCACPPITSKDEKAVYSDPEYERDQKFLIATLGFDLQRVLI